VALITTNLDHFMRKITLQKFVLACCVALSSPLASQVMINEYSCSNVSLTDNFGETPDWIELYNAGAAPVSLAGYYLSDKPSNPDKWTFPSGITVPAGGFVRIWCSGKDVIVGTDYHSGIKFTQTQPEAIVFSDPGGALLETITLDPTQRTHSRGRTTDGASTWSLFLTPTPGTSNTSPFLNYASKPVLSVAEGFYSGSQVVSITSPDAGVAIHYTTDGSTPTTGSALYSAPVNIAATTVLRARAFSSNPQVPPSFVASNTYFIGVTHTVPVVSAFGDEMITLLTGTQLEAETGLEYFNETGAKIAETQGVSDEHGNDSWSYNQRGFDFISKDEMGYNYGVNAPIFINKDRDSYQRLIFKAAANDNYPFATGGAHIRDSYCHTLSQRAKLNMDERTWAPAVVYVNGQYWGMYDVREKVDDLDFTDHYYKQDEPYVQFLQTWGGTWTPYGGPAAQTDWNALRNFITTNNMAVASNYAYVDSLFNVKSFVDYFVFNSWLVTSDWLDWNTAWWRGLDPDGDKKKWRYTLWDMDAILGHYINYTGVPDTSPEADPCNVEGLPDPGGQGHTQILNALMANDDFKQYYQARYVDLMNTGLSCDFVLPLYDSMIAVITPEMPAQIARWGGTLTAWQANAAAFRQNLVDRCNAMSQGMIDCYNLTGPFAITVDVVPAGAGQAKVNSITPAAYVFNATYFGGMNTIFRAEANPGYAFDHWDFSNHTPTPSSVNDSVAVDLTTTDNIIAVFRKPEEPPGGEEVAVPTAFSPNNDSNNDILYVLGSVDQLDFTIYNRWGQQVFRSTDRSKGWDGTFNGSPLNAGVFAYRLSGITPDGKQVVRKGNITLVR
jgi:gliding motility-associated-like protein